MRLEDLKTFLPILWSLLVFNFVGNLLILIIILKSKDLRRKATIMYIVNGAAANIIFCVFAQGTAVVIRTTSILPKSRLNCPFYDILFYLTSFVMVFTIVAIALDKYFAIMSPFRYHLVQPEL